MRISGSIRARQALFTLFAATIGCSGAARAQDATWLAAPASNDFNSGPNWSPATVPTGTALFGLSNTTTITNGNTLNTLQFNAGAPAYTFSGSFALTGHGIVNNSSFAPTFTGSLEFQGNTAAANARINNNFAGVFFEDNSTAATSAISNTGFITFSQNSTAANATIVTNAGRFLLSFADSSTAGSAAITTKAGSLTQFTDSATGGNATITNNAGGETDFGGNASPGSARLINSGGGTFDFSGTIGPNNDNRITAGSIEGSGFFFLGSNQLTVGGNNLSTTVSGELGDGGTNGGAGAALVKIGAGTLTLTGANTYSGGTTINRGLINFNAANNFGTGNITLDGGGLQWAAGTTTDISGQVAPLGAAGGTFDTNGNNVALASPLSGAGGVTKQGAGTLTLTAIETYTGATTVNAGTLALGPGGSLAASSGINLLGGSSFDISGGGNQTIQDFSGVSGSSVTLGANSLVAGTANSTTFAGTISGAGGVTKQGAGTLTLTAIETYTGATTVNAGTLALGPGGSLAASSGINLMGGSRFDISGGGNQMVKDLAGAGGTVSVGANTLTFGTADSASFGGSFTGSGGLNKLGAGTFTLTGNSGAFTGTTTAGAGTLTVGPDAAPDASLGGAVMVQSGGTLTGLGTVGALANTGGIVAPGGSIGTLTVAGNFVQASAGTLQIEVSPTAASQLAVSGTASLAGRLALIFDPGVYTVRNYTLLTAARVGGAFATVTGANPSGLAQTLLIDPADVTLQLANPAAPGAPPAEPPPPTVIVIAPTNDTIYTAASSVAVLNGQRANGVILDRLGNRQAGIADGQVAAAAAAPVQYAQAGGAGSLGAVASALPAATEGAWFRGLGGFASVGGSAAAPGFTGTAGGFLAGFDRPVAENVYLGIAGGYAHSTVDEHSSANGAIDTGRVALYGGAWWCGNLLTATAGYAHDTFTTERGLAGIGAATQSHGGNEATAAAQWSRPLPMQGFGGGLATVTPKAGVQFLHLSEGSFAESGAGGFDLSSATRGIDSVQPYIGVAAAQKFVTAGGAQFTPELRLGYAREALSSARLITVTTASGASFPVTGVTPSRDVVTAGFGVTMQAGPALSLYANYDGTLRTGNTTDQTLSAGLRVRF